MNWQNLNWVDYTIITVLTLSTLISLIRGFVREALSLVIWIGALWLAYRYSSFLATHLFSSIDNPSLRLPIAFAVVFFAVLIVGSILSFIINSLVHSTGLSGTDRILGIVFGLARGVLLIGVLTLVGHMTQVNKTEWWEKSQMLPQFEGLAEWLHSILPEKFGQLGNMSKDTAAPETTEPAAAAPATPTPTPAAPAQPAATESSATPQARP